MNAKTSLVLVLFFFFLLSSLFIFSTDKVLDPDSFYHIRHAWLYRTEGLFQTDFPWAQFSVIRLNAADVWYGFHIFLIPFAYLKDLFLGIKLSAIVFSAISLFLIYWALRRQSIFYALFWAVLLYFATPDFIFHFNMSRPQTLSIGLLALIFSFLAQGGKRKFWALVSLSAASSFIHLNLFWTVLAVVVVLVGARWFVEKKFDWRGFLAVAAGLTTGWLLRPNPIGALKILWVQIFELAAVKQQGLPLLFGEELHSLTWEGVQYKLLPILLLWLAGVIFLGWLIKSGKLRLAVLSADTKIWLWGSLALSVVFLILAFQAGQRAADFFALFAVFFVSQLSGFLRQEGGLRRRSAAVNLGAIFLVSIFLIMIFRHSAIFNRYANADYVSSPDRLKDAALWLRNNAGSEEIVFHSSWDVFPILFFWNQKNYYINGMDPIFEYSFSPELYWKNLIITLAGRPYTCSGFPCNEKNGESLHKVIKEDFGASYAVLELNRNSALNRNLKNDPAGFQQVWGTEKEIIYKVL